MKKIISILTIVLVSLTAKAQTVYIGGTAGFSYSNEITQVHLLPTVGYEFNKKIALGIGVGAEFVEEESAAIFNPYLRFTPWQNDRVSFDIKVGSFIESSDGYTISVNGITPSLRCKLNDKWEICTDLGTIGAICDDGDWTACMAIKNVTINAAVHYRF